MFDLFNSRPGPADSAGLKEVPVAQLRVGMYVVLNNCSWFKHPFPLKSFRLTSRDQIKTIVGLGLKTVPVDVEKSDPNAFRSSAEEAPAQARKSQPTAPGEANVPADEAAAASESSTSPELSSPFSMEQYEDTLQAANQAFKQALQDSTRIMKELSLGEMEGYGIVQQMVDDQNERVQDDDHTNAFLSTLNLDELPGPGALHALNVCALAMKVGKQLALGTEQIRILGIGALFHDIGESRVPATIVKQQGVLTSMQQRQFEEHAKIPTFPALGFTIIQEHHERLDGSGYPFGLKANKLSFLSHIVMAVDEFESLINPRDPAHMMSPAEALSYLYAKRQDALSKDVIVAMIQTLGLYPPGSTVQLSEGSLGLVLSTNSEDRSRPMVLLYDPHGSQEPRRIVNLMDSPSLSISQAVLTKDLRPEVAGYLNLKRWVGYSLHSSLGVTKALHPGLPEAA
ncbi:MAG: DUF3391 domain-containing protein [Nitrospirae bacterium]|nr:DUF3391 domain-containing protein [Nitrospirota bacterium]